MIANFWAVMAIVLGGVAPAAPVTIQDEVNARSAGRTIYVSAQGSDANAGTKANPWKTLAPLERTALPPGSSIRLKHNVRINSAVNLTTSGLTVSGYGKGNPVFSGGCLRISGANITLKNVAVKNCQDNAITVTGDNAKIYRVTVAKNKMGIWVEAGARNTRISYSKFINNNRMARNTPCDQSNYQETCDDDYGASGISVQGSYTTVKGNYFSGNVAKSLDYGLDGSSVEIFAADHTKVLNNVAKDEFVFSELGGADVKAHDTIYKNNRMESSRYKASFLITRGTGVFWGPVPNTVATNNKVLLNGKESLAFYCAPNCNRDILAFNKNVIAGSGAGWVEGTMNSTNNVYCGEWTDGLRASGTDRIKTLPVTSLSLGQLKKDCR